MNPDLLLQDQEPLALVVGCRRVERRSLRCVGRSLRDLLPHLLPGDAMSNIIYLIDKQCAHSWSCRTPGAHASESRTTT